jgi:transcriptional regulator with PAS, ATPase and Fis domain
LSQEIKILIIDDNDVFSNTVQKILTEDQEFRDKYIKRSVTLIVEVINPILNFMEDNNFADRFQAIINKIRQLASKVDIILLDKNLDTQNKDIKNTHCIDVEEDVWNALTEDNLLRPIILYTGFPDNQQYIEYFKKGVIGIVEKKLVGKADKEQGSKVDEDLRDIKLHIAGEIHRILNIRERGWQLSKRGDANIFNKDIVNNSSKMKDVINLSIKYASSDRPVLITGETGVGKERIARLIHSESLRHEKPFIPINCSAIPENLIESEFFGNEKGAYTGATVKKEGLFYAANGGTLFLDEIGELPLTQQAKMLRVIQEGEIQPVGSSKCIKVDVRIVAATNSDLDKMRTSKRFRDDLYYRICVHPIFIAPLRDRTEDIVPLANFILGKEIKLRGNKNLQIDDQLIDAFCKYNWPGNVRELENIIIDSYLLSTNQSDFSIKIASEIAIRQNKSSIQLPSIGQSPAEEIEMNQKEIIIKTLISTGNNISATSDRLKISRNTLYTRIKQYGINMDQL